MKQLIAIFLILFSQGLYAQTARFVYPISDNNIDIKDVFFSPDNKFILSRTRELLSVYSVELGRLIYTLDVKFRSPIRFAENGKSVVIYDVNNIVILDLNTGIKRIIDLQINLIDSYKIRISVSPNQKLIAVGNNDDSTFIICTDIDKKIFKRYSGGVESILFSEDGRYIVTYYKNTLFKWDLKDNKLVKAISVNNIWQRRISTDMMKIAYWEKDTISVWNFITNKTIRIIKKDNSKIIYLEFENNNKEIIAHCYDNVKISWEIASGKLIKKDTVIPKKSSTGYTSISSDKKFKLRYTYEDSIIRLFNNNTGMLLHSVKMSQWDDFNSVAFKISSDGKYFSWSNDNILSVHSVSQNETREYITHSAKLIDVVFSPDNKYFLTNNYDKAILWDAYTGKPVVSMKSNRDGIDCAFNEDGKRLLMWDGRDFDLWSIPEGKKLVKINNLKREKIEKPFISKDGNTIGLMSQYEISIWKDSMKTPVRVIKTDGEISAVPVFNSDGKYLLTAHKNSVLLYQVDSGSTLKEFKRTNADSAFEYVYFSSDDKYMMTHDATHNHATVWDISSGKKLYNLNQQYPQFTKNGKFIIAGEKIYDITNGKLNYPYEGFTLYASTDIPVPGTYTTNYSIKNPNLGKVFQIKNVKSGYTYSMLVMTKNDYLVFDEYGHFDGTEKARAELSLACGNQIMDPKNGLDLLLVPGLAEKIMKGETINAKKLNELKLCEN